MIICVLTIELSDAKLKECESKWHEMENVNDTLIKSLKAENQNLKEQNEATKLEIHKALDAGKMWNGIYDYCTLIYVLYVFCVYRSICQAGGGEGGREM